MNKIITKNLEKESDFQKMLKITKEKVINIEMETTNSIKIHKIMILNKNKMFKKS